jgi:hypothetical protein
MLSWVDAKGDKHFVTAIMSIKETAPNTWEMQSDTPQGPLVFELKAPNKVVFRGEDYINQNSVPTSLPLRLYNR